MKKIFLLSVTALSLSTSAIAMADCGKSIALTNLSSSTVNFSTIADPGYIPKVKVGQDYTLPGDFIVSCNLFLKSVYKSLNCQ